MLAPSTECPQIIHLALFDVSTRISRHLAMCHPWRADARSEPMPRQIRQPPRAATVDWPRGMATDRAITAFDTARNVNSR